MAKKITINQLKQAVKTSPQAVKKYGAEYLRDGINAYQKIVINTSPWRVGQNGGGAPRKWNGLREAHEKRFDFNRLEGRLFVDPKRQANKKYQSKDIKKVIDYARQVHKKRPWLDFAQKTGEKEIEKLYREFGDKILKHIAT